MMKQVYLLRSTSYPQEYYIGIAEDFKARLADHNEGSSKHTAKFRPWKAVVVIQFDDDRKAYAFEQYLKSGSGRAFANRHFR